MFAELVAAKPKKGTALWTLSRAMRHDLRTVASVRAVTGTVEDWLSPMSESHPPLYAYMDGAPIVYAIYPDGAYRYPKSMSREKRKKIV